MLTQLGNGYTNATIDDDLYYKLIEELEDLASDIGAYSSCNTCYEQAEAHVNEIIQKLRRLRK